MKKLLLILLLPLFVLTGCIEKKVDCQDDFAVTESVFEEDVSIGKYSVNIFKLPSETRTDGSMHQLYEIIIEDSQCADIRIVRLAESLQETDGTAMLRFFGENGELELTVLYDEFMNISDRIIPDGAPQFAFGMDGDEDKESWWDCVNRRYEENMDHFEQILGPVIFDIASNIYAVQIVSLAVAIYECS